MDIYWYYLIIPYVVYALIGFAALIFIAHLPLLPIIRILSFDVPNKGKILANVFVAWAKNLLTLIPDLLAPIIVPIALIFTKWEADHLPKPFIFWDNDASINGDKRTDDASDGLGGWALKPVPLEKDSQEAIDMCYWAKGHHPRSFYARWVWLGLRNRASRLSQMLGTSIEGVPEVWSGETWKITRVGNKYRYYELLPIGKLAIRMHCGYKVPKIPGETKAPPVSIGFSLRKSK